MDDRSAFNTDQEKFVNLAPVAQDLGSFKALAGNDWFGQMTIRSVDLETRVAHISMFVTPWKRDNVPQRVDLPSRYSVQVSLYTDGGFGVTNADDSFLPGGGAEVEAEVNLAGDQASFPGDVYRISNLRGFVELRDLDSGDHFIATVGRLNIFVAPSVDSAIRVYPGFQGFFAWGTTCSLGSVVEFRRPSRGETFRWVIALVPLVFLALLLWSAVRGSRSEGRALVETAAALLALLPLRAVLVPSSIVSITNIDIVLGLELLSMVWVLAIGHWLSARREGDPHLNDNHQPSLPV